MSRPYAGTGVAVKEAAAPLGWEIYESPCKLAFAFCRSLMAPSGNIVGICGPRGMKPCPWLFNTRAPSPSRERRAGCAGKEDL